MFTSRSIVNPSSTSLFDRKNSEPGIDNRFILIRQIGKEDSAGPMHTLIDGHCLEVLAR
jgi:hypothetical protein